MERRTGVLLKCLSHYRSKRCYPDGISPGKNMHQSSTNGWQLLVGIIGSSLLTTLGIYLLARFTHVFDAYAGERAKLLAQFHNLDKLMEQTKALTAATEAIKARISDEVWDRQMRWAAKRDMYFRVLKVIGRLMNDQQDTQSDLRLRSKFGNMPDLEKDSEDSLRRLERTMNSWYRVVDIAPLFVSSEAFAIMEKLFAGIRPIPNDAATCMVVCESNINHLKACRSALWKAAKNDLGFPKSASAEGN
jgi:hypothetical protein